MSPNFLKTALLLGGVLALGSPIAVEAQQAATTTHQATVSSGKVVETQTTTATAKIVSIDRAAHTILLKDAKGRITEIEAGPEVRNFSQLKAGDKVRVAYVQALSLELKKVGAKTRATGERQGDIAAPLGAKPAAAAGRVVTVIADVVAIDARTQTVTLRGPKGRSMDLHVKDPAQFRTVALGDHVEAIYAEALAVSVEAAT